MSLLCGAIGELAALCVEGRFGNTLSQCIQAMQLSKVLVSLRSYVLGTGVLSYNS